MAEKIVPLAEGRGACFATDMITCDGRKVAFMHREDLIEKSTAAGS